jgi:hypothetical protein
MYCVPRKHCSHPSPSLPAVAAHLHAPGPPYPWVRDISITPDLIAGVHNDDALAEVIPQRA